MALTTWFTLGAIGMVVGTGLLGYGLTLLPSENRRPFGLLVGVTAIASVAYAIMTLGFGAVTSANGATAFAPRYADWLLTTPMHVAFVATVVGASRSLLGRIAGLQAATIALGFGGAVAPAPLNWLLFAAGSAAFAGVVYYFYTDLDDLADARNDAVAAQFRKLRSFVVVLWSIYPVIWLLAPAGIGLMDVETTALVVAYIDVVAKVGLGLIALSDYLTLADLGAADEAIAGLRSD